MLKKLSISLDDMREFANKTELVEFFSQPLPSKLPSRFDIFSLPNYGFEVSVLPIKSKVKVLDQDQALKNAVDKTDIRPALKGIFHDAENKVKVVTNGSYLLHFPDESIETTKLVNVSTGLEIEDTFPAYRNVIPFHLQMFLVEDLKEVLYSLNGIVRTNKFINKSITCQIIVDEIIFHFNAELLLKVVETLVVSGTTKARFEVNTSRANYGLLIRDAANPSKLGLLMPKMPDDSFPYQILFNKSSSSLPKKDILEHFSKKRIEALRSLSWNMEYHWESLIKAFEKKSDWDINYHKKKLLDSCLEQQRDIDQMKEIIKNAQESLEKEGCIKDAMIYS